MNGLLDPYVLAIPDSDAHEVDCLNYAESLANWSGSISGDLHKVFFSYPLMEALVDADQYPLECNLRKIRGLGSVLTAFDAFRSCERQLTNPPFVENYLPKIDDLKANELAKLIVLPEHVEKRLHPNVTLALRNILAKIAIAADVHNSEFAKQLMFASSGLIQNGEEFVKLNISEAKWKFVLHPDELDDMESWENLSMYAQRGLNRAYRRFCREHTLDPKSQFCPEPEVGDEFFNIILQNNYHRNEGLISDLFRNTVLALLSWGGYEKKGKKHHELRVDDEPANPPIIRKKDGAVAWRVWITTGRPAYRLHYWRLEDGAIELSKIGPHEDYTIV